MRDDISYLAGIFDGEGCISIQSAKFRFGRRVSTRLLVSCGMKTPEPLRLLQKHFGGTIGRYAQGTCVLNAFRDGIALPPLMNHWCLELAHLLKGNRAKGKRFKGADLISPSEILRRESIASEVTKMKNYADA